MRQIGTGDQNGRLETENWGIQMGDQFTGKVQCGMWINLRISGDGHKNEAREWPRRAGQGYWMVKVLHR